VGVLLIFYLKVEKEIVNWGVTYKWAGLLFPLLILSSPVVGMGLIFKQGENSLLFPCELKLVIFYTKALIYSLFGWGTFFCCCRVPREMATSSTELGKASFT